jgi:predicted nucleic acid-binding protein
MKVCLDTNVFIAIKNKEEHFEYCTKILDAIEEKHIEGSVSTIVLTEVLVGFYLKNENTAADRFLSSSILNFDIVPVNIDIAKKAAQMRAQFRIKLPDAMITASSINSNSDYFITFNKSMLKKLEIQVLSPVEFVKNHLNV